ncbi:MAG: TetR/AcrR family transcriptional regulator [Burkholderiales bacterium]
MKVLAPTRRIPAQRSRNAEHSREAILKAAVREFAQEGVAGARTDEIAHAAGVNKALLYYYFKDKEGLYGAVLDFTFTGLRERVVPILDSDLDAGEKIVRYVSAYFDYLAQSPFLPRLVQMEMMRAGRNPSPHLRRLVTRHFRPLFEKVVRTFEQGIVSGEFRPVDPVQFLPSIVGMCVHYFISAPVVRIFLDADPLLPEHIAARKAAVLDVVAAALFVDREHGFRIVQSLHTGAIQ